MSNEISNSDMKCNEVLDNNGYDDTSPVAIRALYTILTTELSNVSVTITRIKKTTHGGSSYEARMYNHYTGVECSVSVEKIKVGEFNRFMLFGLILANDLIGVYPSPVWENSERFKFCPERVLLFPSVVGLIENMSPNDEIVVVSQLYSCSLDNLDIDVIQNQNVDIFSELPNFVEQLNLLHKQGFVHNNLDVCNVYCNIIFTHFDENKNPVYKVSFHLGNFKNCYMGKNYSNGIFKNKNDIRGIGDIILFLVKKVCIQKNPMLTTLYNSLFVIATCISNGELFDNEQWTLENITAILHHFCYKINN
jgi:hypothetical protein